MISNIKAIIIACTISIATAFSLASSAEYNARLAAAELVLKHHNDVQRQFSYERETMKEHVSKAIDRSLSRLPTESP
ncbi:hypothetical protein [Pseudomonas monteilii]|uniref:hypothetical protein n=1 Tax=Pseudomonas monteilii TaxID=76759 RepID=UPI000863597C|nr:hypothetical protein [Pseudomonas monteilii]